MSATAGTPAAGAGAPPPSSAPAGQSAGAGTPPPAAATTPPAGASSQDWTSGLNEEMKGYVKNKGFTDPAMALDSYRNLEKLIGTPKERILRLPENMDDAQAMGEIYARLGRPATAEEYKITPNKDGSNADFANFLKSAFYENGLTAKQATGIVSKWNEMHEKVSQGLNEQYNAKIQTQADALKKEWGAAYEQKINVAKHAARAFGVSPETVTALETAMGFDGVMKFFDAVGSKIGEAQFVNPNRSDGFSLTPDAAMSKISRLKSDPEFIKKYAGGDSNARAEMDRLHKMAYPDM
jgi:hypothetical protein